MTQKSKLCKVTLQPRGAHQGHRLLLHSVVTRKSLWAVSYMKRGSSDCCTLLLLDAEANRSGSRERKRVRICRHSGNHMHEQTKFSFYWF